MKLYSASVICDWNLTISGGDSQDYIENGCKADLIAPHRLFLTKDGAIAHVIAELKSWYDDARDVGQLAHPFDHTPFRLVWDESPAHPYLDATDAAGRAILRAEIGDLAGSDFCEGWVFEIEPRP